MGAQRFTDLVAWQLSNQLKTEVDAILERPGHAAIAGSANRHPTPPAARPRWPRVWPLRSPRVRPLLPHGSREPLETQNHLIDARDTGHHHPGEFDPLWALAEHAIATVTALLRYLDGGERRGRRS
ncbi:MAG: hypothetical protein R2712_17735 [Vicinamibacterales bacterium]